MHCTDIGGRGARQARRILRPRNAPDVQVDKPVAISRAALSPSHGCRVRPWGVGWLVVMSLTGCGGGDFPTDEANAGAAAASDAAVALPSASSSVEAALRPVPASSPASGAEAQLVIRRQPQSVEVREGGVAQFSVDVDGPHPITYQWLYDDKAIGGQNGPTIRVSVRPADHLADISVIIGAGHKTIKSNSAVLRVSRD